MIAGQKLREFRERLGVTPIELARAIGIPRQQIPQVEKTDEVGRRVAERYVEGVLRASGSLPREMPDGPYERVEINPVIYVGGRIRPW